MKKSISGTLSRARRFPVLLIGEGLLVGGIGGFVVVLYRMALDVAGAKMLNIDPAVATHIAAAEALGLGTADLSRVNIKRIRL